MDIASLFRLDEKRVLITGSSSGIGQLQALAMISVGARLVVHGSNQAKIDETLQLLGAAGGEAHGVCLALDGSRSNAQDLVRQAAELLGGLDIVINCAGTNRRKEIEDVTEEDYELIRSVNLDSLYWISQAAIPYMREAGGGKILHIGSMTTFRGLGMLSVYGMTKGAVGQLTQSMATELAKHNIQVNGIAPGFIDTPLTTAGLFGDTVRKKWIFDRIPAGRRGLPADLVGATIFLCSHASDYVTGQMLAVDGGFLTGGSWAIHATEEQLAD